LQKPLNLNIGVLLLDIAKAVYGAKLVLDIPVGRDVVVEKDI